MARLAVFDPSDPRHAFAAPAVLRAALEAVPIGILLVNPDGAIVHSNTQVERLFGHPAAELIGGTIHSLIPDGLDDSAEPEIRRERSARRRDGSELPVEVAVSPIRIADTTLTLISILDIRERRRLQGELEALRDERLDFEALIGDLGAELANLRPREADWMIEEALGRLVRAVDLDRGVIHQLADDDDFVTTHQWTKPGLPVPLERVSARALFPWHLARVRANELVSFSSCDEVPDETDRENLRRYGVRSGITVPLVADGRVRGAVSFASQRETRAWPPDVVHRFRVVALLFANVLARKQADEQLRLAVAESATVRERLRDENAYLRNERKGFTGESAIVGHSPAIRQVIEQARRAAATDAGALLVGEPGTGKSRLAEWIHELGPRGPYTLVRVNCRALNAASVEAALLGVERGSYGEHEDRQIGRLELAHRSTIVFEDIGDLPLTAQATLTGVLQHGRLQPLGSTRDVPVDVRMVATTRTDLARAVADGSFRRDLYDRLNAVAIHVPPLRDRPEDIPPLVWRFVDEIARSLGRPIDSVDRVSMAALQRYRWPGNARELRNAVERAMIVAAGRRLQIPVPRGAASARTRATPRR